MPLEIQVRTAMQEAWATLFERIADEWGRQIRYGGAPDDGHPIAAQCLDIMERISKNIAGIETTEGSLAPLRAEVEQLPPSMRNQLRDPVVAAIETARAVMAEQRPLLQSTLTKLAGIIDQANETTEEGV